MTEKIAGIYKITNNITGESYIGSSKNIKKRWANHKSPSQWASKPGMRLYQAFINYGLDNFKFEVIEETTRLKEREQYWIGALKPAYNNRRADGQDIKRYKKRAEGYNKIYYNRLCLYEGKTMTLNALKHKFQCLGIAHALSEATKYLINNFT